MTGIETIHYESFKSGRVLVAEAWRTYDQVLIDCRTKSPVAGIQVSKRVLATVEGPVQWVSEPKVEPIPTVLQVSMVVVGIGYDSQPPAQYVLFSKDPRTELPEWMVQIRQDYDFFIKHFVPKSPMLVLDHVGGRMRLSTQDGTPLATRVEVWRDSDAARGVEMQFIVENDDHVLALPALWSLFASSVENWFVYP